MKTKKILGVIVSLIAFFNIFTGCVNRVESRISLPDQLKTTDWVKYIESEKGIHYLATNSFTYYEQSNIAKCWTKYVPKDNDTSNKEHLTEISCDFKNKNLKMKLIERKKNDSEGHVKNTQTITSSEYDSQMFPKTLAFLCSLKKNKMQWEFNTKNISTYSNLNSNSWEKFTKSGSILFDTNTIRENGNLVYQWIFLKGQNSLIYMVSDVEKEKTAAIKQVLLDSQGNVKFELVEPLLIWFDSKDIFFDNEKNMQAVNLLIQAENVFPESCKAISEFYKS